MFTTREEYQLHLAERQKRNSQTPFRQFLSRIQAINPYAGNPIGIDVSHYQPYVDWKYLSNYLTFGIAKCSEVMEEADEKYWHDSMFAQHIQGMYDAKIEIILAYTFCNGGAWGLHVNYGLDAFRNLPRGQNAEYKKLAETLTNKTYHGIVLDLERYWRHYNQYLNYLNGVIPISGVELIPSNWIFASFKLLVENIWDGMKAKEIRTVPIIVYSAPWFINTYMNASGTNLFTNWAPRLEEAGVKMFIASYVTPSEVTTWEDLRSNHLPSGIPDKMGMNGFPLFQQFGGGNMKLPNGTYGSNGFDVDISLVKREDLMWWFFPNQPKSSPSASISSSPSPSGSSSISLSWSPSDSSSSSPSPESPSGWIPTVEDRLTHVEEFLEQNTSNHFTKLINKSD